MIDFDGGHFEELIKSILTALLWLTCLDIALLWMTIQSDNRRIADFYGWPFGNFMKWSECYETLGHEWSSRLKAVWFSIANCDSGRKEIESHRFFLSLFLFFSLRFRLCVPFTCQWMQTLVTCEWEGFTLLVIYTIIIFEYTDHPTSPLQPRRRPSLSL